MEYECEVCHEVYTDKRYVRVVTLLNDEVILACIKHTVDELEEGEYGTD